MAAVRLRLTRGRVTQGTWRRRNRFSRMIGSPMIWSGIGAIALAVGLGVQLGESAVREIDPLYFQGPAARPEAVEPIAQAPAPLPYGWETGNAARLAESAVDYPYAPTPIPIALPAAAPVEAPQPLSLASWPPGRISSHPEVERYTDYPIEQKLPDQAEPAEDDPVPADAGE